MISEEFKSLLKKAVDGDNDAIMQIIELYEPLINNNSIINGKFDEDLKQYILLRLIKNIRKFM